jgi:glycosyltransferase involved in cell wall biosynthesis
MTPPLVSVVMPTHNRSVTLRRAVDSVLSQTHSDLELIVVDDASTDDTPALLAVIEDPRLVCIRLERNSGAAIARNRGIRSARGELVAFQDSDDVWLPEKLALQLRVMAESAPSVGAVGGRWVAGAEHGGTEIRAPALEAGGDYEAELLDGHCLITPVWLVRRALLEQLGLFDERMPCLEDWDLMLRLSQRTAMRAVPETVLIKYGAPDSLGADFGHRATAMEELLRRHGKRFLALPRRHASFCLELAYLCVLRGRLWCALRYAARSLRRRGASPAMLVAFVKASIGARVLHRHAWPVPGMTGE